MMKKVNMYGVIAIILACVLMGCGKERKASDVFVAAQEKACDEFAAWMETVDANGSLQFQASSVSECMKIFLAMVNEENVTISQEELSLDGEKLTCSVYICRPTKVQLQEVLRNVSAWIEENPLPEWTGLFLQEAVVTSLLDDVDMTAAKLEEQNLQWRIYVVNDRIHKQRIEWNNDNALEYETIGKWSNGRYDAFRRLQHGEEIRLVISKIATEGLSYNGELISWKKGQEQKNIMRFSFDGKGRSALGIPEGVVEAKVDETTVRMEVTKSDANGYEHSVSMIQPESRHEMRLISEGKTVSSGASGTIEVNGKEYSTEEVKSQIRQLLWDLIEKCM